MEILCKCTSSNNIINISGNLTIFFVFDYIQTVIEFSSKVDTAQGAAKLPEIKVWSPRVKNMAENKINIGKRWGNSNSFVEYIVNDHFFLDDEITQHFLIQKGSVLTQRVEYLCPEETANLILIITITKRLLLFRSEGCFSNAE